MSTKQSWFVYLTLAIFEVFAAYALFSAITDMGGSGAYPFIWYGGLLCLLAAVFVLTHAVCCLLAQWDLPGMLPGGGRSSKIIERVIVAAALSASAALRIWAIARFPIAPSSDYQTYYQIAGLLSKGILSSSGYSGYIAEFPHVIGYPFILSQLFRITGPSLPVGLYLNLAASLANAYLAYRIARTLCGRLSGMVALLAQAFWPSQILYGAILASEPVFTSMTLLCVWLFIYLYRYPVRLGNREGAMFLCVTLGVSLALANAVRPLSTILLIAVALCFLPFVIRFDRNAKMLNGKLARASCQGWFLALVVFFSFTLCSRLVDASISGTIAYQLPGAAVSYGYNLMVGVNIDAKGAWSQQDADFFANAFASTNSAEAAHRASLGVAMQRIAADPAGVLNLALEKFTFLWGNDDYAATWTALFLGQQGILTPERQNIIGQLNRWNDYFYLFGVFFSAVAGLQFLRRKYASPAQALVLLCIGTALLHMILECQNRYHYFILPVFAILSAMGVAEIYRDYARAQGRGSNPSGRNESDG